MSTIAVIVNHMPTPKAIMSLQKATGLPLSTIRACVMNGQTVWEEELFDERYDEKAAALRAILVLCKTKAVQCCFYELPEGDIMKSSSSQDKYKITFEVLSNILDTADAELDRQFKM